MQRRELLVPVAHGKRLRRLDKAARSLGVFFNIHWFSLGLPKAPLRHDCGIFIGFPLTALTFLNRQRVVALISGLTRMWARSSPNGRACPRDFGINLALASTPHD